MASTRGDEVTRAESGTVDWDDAGRARLAGSNGLESNLQHPETETLPGLFGHYVDHGEVDLDGRRRVPRQRWDVFIYEDDAARADPQHTSMNLYASRRLDRLSSTMDGYPVTFTIQVDFGSGEFTAAELFLWNKSRLVDVNPLYPTLDIPYEVLVDAVKEYSLAKSGARESIHQSQIASPATLKLLRGRQRRRARRHHITTLTASTEPQSMILTMTLAITPSKIPAVPQPIPKTLRGRQRRLQRRKMARGQCQDETSRESPAASLTPTNLEPQEDPTIAMYKKKAVTLNVPTWASSNSHIIFESNEHARESLIAIKIPGNGPNGVFGSFLTPRSIFFGKQDNWTNRWGAKTITISSMSIWNENNCKVQSRSYWRKYPIYARTAYAEDNRLASIGGLDYEFLLSVAWSFCRPPLVFPDQDGILASEEEYMEVWYLGRNDAPPRVQLGSREQSLVNLLENVSREWQVCRRRPYTESKPAEEGLSLVTKVVPPTDLPEPPTYQIRSSSDGLKAEFYFQQAIDSLAIENQRQDWTVEAVKRQERAFKKHNDRDPPVLNGNKSNENAIQDEGAPHGDSTAEVHGTIPSFVDSISYKEDLPSNDTHPNPRLSTAWSHNPSPELQPSLEGNDDRQSPTQPTMNEIWRGGSDYFIDSIEGGSDIFHDRESVDVFDLFYGARLHNHVPLWVQETTARKISKILLDDSHHPHVIAHGILCYGLCLLMGFGVEKDTDAGLNWVLRSAILGSRRARGAVRRLYRDYNRQFPSELCDAAWLFHEAKEGSSWSKEELKLMGYEYPQTARAASTLDFDLPHSVRDKCTDPSQWLQCHLPGFSWDKPRALTWELSGLHFRTTHLSDLQKIYEDALRLACISSSSEVVKVLLTARMANLNDRSPVNIYLGIAAHCGNTRVVREILRLASQTPGLLSNRLGSGDNPLYFIENIPCAEVEGVVKAILAAGFDVNDKAEVDNVLQRDWSRLAGSYDAPRRFSHWAAQVDGVSITPLRWAILHNNVAMVKALISCGARFPVMPNSDAYSSIKPRGYPIDICDVAILDEPCYNIDILRLFLDKHGRQKYQAPFAETPLGLIVMELDGPSRRLKYGELCHPDNLYPILDLLRPYQPESDAQLFWAAVMNDHIEIVRYLIQRKTNTEIRFKGMTPLHTAILHGRMDIFNLLLESGADCHAVTTTKGLSAVHLIFWNPKPLTIEKAMIDTLHRRQVSVEGAGSPFGTKARIRPLHLAVLNNRQGAVDHLLRLGADRAAAAGRDFMTTLTGARYTSWGVRQAKHHPPEGDRSRKVAPKPISLQGCTPLGILLTRIDMFIPHDAVSMLWLLLGPPAEGPGDVGRYYTRAEVKQTVLHMIACTDLLREAGMFARVLEHGKLAGLRVDIPDAHGDTPLHYAALLRPSMKLAAVDQLLALGADPASANQFGLTPASLRLWGHALLSKRPGDDGETNLTLVLEPRELRVRRGLVPEDKSKSECKGLWAEWHAATPVSDREMELGRMWERLCCGFDVNEIWDVDEKRPVELQSPLWVHMYTSEDITEFDGFVNKSKYFADAIIRHGDVR